MKKNLMLCALLLSVEGLNVIPLLPKKRARKAA